MNTDIYHLLDILASHLFYYDYTAFTTHVEAHLCCKLNTLPINDD